MRLRDIHVPAPWAAAAERLKAATGPVVILGAIDAGKSVFARYLLGRTIAERGAAALLDGDVGMATVGTPAVVGLTLVLDVDALDGRTAPDRTWFVGSTTPVGHLLPLVLGHAHLGGIARSEGLGTVVNTSGLVGGGLGKELQLAVIDAVRAQAVVGIGGEGELDHLLAPLERRGLPVHRLSPSPRARAKPRSERSSLRAERFARYFAEARPVTLDLAQLSVEGTLLGSGRPLSEAERGEIEQGLDMHLVEAEDAGDAIALIAATAPHDEAVGAVARALGNRHIHVLEEAATRGSLLGLAAGDGECIGLGLLGSWAGNGALEVLTPLDDQALKSVRRLRLGSLRLARTGEELGWAERERVLGSEAGG